MKKKVKEEVYSKYFDGNCYDIRFSDFPKNIQENDIVEILREDSYFSENNSYDAYTQLVIIREREETDEEYQERISDNEKTAEQLRQMRYKNYLKLKAEFEPGSSLMEQYAEFCKNNSKEKSVRYTKALDIDFDDDIYTIKEWDEAVMGGWICNEDGCGYWVKDGLKSNDEVFSTHKLDATHVVWYNK
jgi:hypothetical protein